MSFSSELANRMYKHDIANQNMAPSYLHAINTWLRQLAPDEGEVTFLDLAAGQGQVADLIKRAHPSWRVIENDLSARVLAQNSDFLGHDILRFSGDMLDLPLKRECVDLIHIKDALVHIDNRCQFVEGLSAILKRKGYVLITTAQESISKTVQCFAGKISDVRITTIDDYVYYASLMKSMPGLCYQPPTFRTMVDEVIQDFLHCNFLLVKKNSWKPQPKEQDWYPKTEPRWVLIFQKQ